MQKNCVSTLKCVNFVKNIDLTVPRVVKIQKRKQSLFVWFYRKMVGKSGDLKLEDLAFLNSPHVKIKNPAKVEFMLNDLRRGGLERFQVISDFDYTITKQKMDNGESVLTSFGMFNKCQSLPASYLEESKRLFKMYRPIEISATVDHETKVKAMIEWWDLSGEILKGFRLPRKEIEDLGEHFKHALRDGTQEFFNDLNEHSVPCLVFSAGLGDCVVAVLKHSRVLYPNVKVVSNFLQYGEDDILDGFHGKMIHTFNKNEQALEGTDYYDLVRTRDHVMVLGDSVGDAKMADGVPTQQHVLKIGFLYHDTDHLAHLDNYLEAFDIVLIDDQTMDVPRAIFDLVKNGE